MESHNLHHNAKNKTATIIFYALHGVWRTVYLLHAKACTNFRTNPRCIHIQLAEYDSPDT